MLTGCGLVKRRMGKPSDVLVNLGSLRLLLRASAGRSKLYSYLGGSPGLETLVNKELREAGFVWSLPFIGVCGSLEEAIALLKEGI